MRESLLIDIFSSPSIVVPKNQNKQIKSKISKKSVGEKSSKALSLIFSLSPSRFGIAGDHLEYQ